MLRELVSLAEGNSGGPFVDARLPFYRLHARQWLMIAFARAATEFPASLAPFASRVVDFALVDQPHVMIRLFATRTALALIEHGTLAAEDGLVDSLSQVNATRFPVVNSTAYQRMTHKPTDAAKTAAEDRFYFGIDIGPYWYEPLGGVFALSQSDIETKALTVIRHELNFSAERARREDERARRNLYDHQQTYASHGDYPDTDDLHHYLSYHAMMIVAGKLLATTPIHCDTEGGERDEFAEWLSRHDLSRNDGRWLSDRRDPTPLEWSAWKAKRNSDPKSEVLTPTDFEDALGTNNILNIWGYWSIADSTCVRSVHVRSALVSRDRSAALLRALSTTKDAYDYVIPSAETEFQIDQAGFVLTGWIEDRSRARELDGKDHWSGGVHYPPPAPTTEIVELMALATDSDKRVWRNETKVAVMSSQVWGHLKMRYEEDNPKRGERLQASPDFVTELLSKVKHDLIIQVQIRTYRRYESREDDDGELPTGTKLYLVKADGRVTTL